MTSPTQRSLEVMRGRGYLADVVERWIPNSPAGYKGSIIRKDLFGFGDVLCVGDHDVVIVQSTTRDNVPARVRKIEQHENLAAIRRGGITILVHGWYKRKGRWQCREVNVS